VSLPDDLKGLVVDLPLEIQIEYTGVLDLVGRVGNVCSEYEVPVGRRFLEVDIRSALGFVSFFWFLLCDAFLVWVASFFGSHSYISSVFVCYHRC
jgi:hypothetical protein